MKKIIAALPLPAPFWTANTFVDGYPNVSEPTRRFERHEARNWGYLNFRPTSWVAVMRNRIEIAHGRGYAPCADQIGYPY